MSNASTVRRQVAGTQQLTIASILGTVVTTTETPFTLNNNGLTLTGGGIIPLAAGNTGLYQGTGQVLWLHAAGTITATTANVATLILKLYVAPASSLPLVTTTGVVDTVAQAVTAGAVLIATSGTLTLAAGRTSASWSLDAYLTLDQQGNLQGNFESQMGVLTTDSATITTTPLTGEADLNFFLTATQGVAETGNVVTADEIELSLV